MKDINEYAKKMFKAKSRDLARLSPHQLLRGISPFPLSVSRLFLVSEPPFFLSQVT
jgi:hypothetical protein